MIPVPAKKKKSKRTFGKGGKGPGINNPDTHHGTYDLPNASVRSYSEKAKPRKFAEGGSTTFAEEFKKARAKGAGTIFDWKGQKIAAYRKGEEPESWKKGKKEEPKKEAAPKSESKPEPKKEAAPKPEPKREAPAAPRKPTTQDETNRNQAAAALASARMIAARNEREEAARRDAAMSPQDRYNRNVAEAALASARMNQPRSGMETEAAKQFAKLAREGGPMAEYFKQQAIKFGATFAKGGSVESKSMMKKEVAFMKKKGAPKSMIKHEMAEAKGMKSGGMACGGMKKYAAGGMTSANPPKKPYTPTAGDINEKAGGDQEMEMRMERGYRPGGRGPLSRNAMRPKAPGYARGGGVESHGKTKGTMVKMASGGSVSARADGVAQRGKTNCKIC